jgi:hypothetical protein
LHELNLTVSFPVYTVAYEQSGRPILKRSPSGALVIPLYPSEIDATRKLETEAPASRLLTFNRPQELSRFLRACARFEDTNVSRVAWCTRVDASKRVITLTIEEFVGLIERPLDDESE